MRDVHHAIESLRQRTKLSAFALDASGRAVMVFDGTIPVEFRMLDEREMELLAPVEEAPADEASAALRKLLEANYLGEATGAARVALEPGSGRIVLCERLAVQSLDDEALEKKVLSFVRYVAFWHSGAMESVLEGRPDSGSDTASDDDAAVILRG